MKLYYNLGLNKHAEIKNRMDAMTLAFEIEKIEDGSVRLLDGSQTYEGELEITKHLDAVAGELHNWYYCNC